MVRPEAKSHRVARLIDRVARRLIDAPSRAMSELIGARVALTQGAHSGASGIIIARINRCTII